MGFATIHLVLMAEMGRTTETGSGMMMIVPTLQLPGKR